MEMFVTVKHVLTSLGQTNHVIAALSIGDKDVQNKVETSKYK